MLANASAAFDALLSYHSTCTLLSDDSNHVSPLCCNMSRANAQAQTLLLKDKELGESISNFHSSLDDTVRLVLVVRRAVSDS